MNAVIKCDLFFKAYNQVLWFELLGISMNINAWKFNQISKHETFAAHDDADDDEEQTKIDIKYLKDWQKQNKK